MLIVRLEARALPQGEGKGQVFLIPQQAKRAGRCYIKMGIFLIRSLHNPSPPPWMPMVQSAHKHSIYMQSWWLSLNLN